LLMAQQRCGSGMILLIRPFRMYMDPVPAIEDIFSCTISEHEKIGSFSAIGSRSGLELITPADLHELKSF
jgi:hypothetical protein